MKVHQFCSKPGVLSAEGKAWEGKAGCGVDGRSKPSRGAGAALSNWAVREWMLRKDS